MSKYETFIVGKYYDWEQPYVNDRFDMASGKKPVPKMGGFPGMMGGPKPYTEEEILAYNRKWNPYDPLYTNPEYARSQGYSSVPAYPGFAKPMGGGMMLAFPKDIADKFVYTHDGGAFEIRSHIFAGDMLTPGKSETDFHEGTVTGSETRIWCLNGYGETVNAKGEVILAGTGDIREGYSKIIDGSTPQTFSENMAEWYDYFPPAHYTTDEEWDFIRELWSKEEIRGENTLYWEDVQVGWEAPKTCTSPITYMDMCQWYGARALSREVLSNPDSLKTMYRDHNGNFFNDTCIHLGNRNHPKGRMVWYNDTGANCIYRTITNFIGNKGRVSKYGWRFFPFYKELRTGTIAAEMFNKVEGMEGRDCDRHGSEGDACIGRAVVTGKYINDRGEHCIEIALWGETLDGDIVQACPSEAVLPSRG